MRIEIMMTVVTQKFCQHPELAKKLVAVPDEALCEINDGGDKFFGVDAESGEGQNWLGRILRSVKKQLIAVQ